MFGTAKITTTLYCYWRRNRKIQNLGNRVRLTICGNPYEIWIFFFNRQLHSKNNWNVIYKQNACSTTTTTCSLLLQLWWRCWPPCCCCCWETGGVPRSRRKRGWRWNKELVLQLIHYAKFSILRSTAGSAAVQLKAWGVLTDFVWNSALASASPGAARFRGEKCWFSLLQGVSALTFNYALRSLENLA